PSPEGRFQHAAVRDPLRDRMLVHGGNTIGTTWALNLSGSPSWSRVDAAGPAPERSRHVLVFDPIRDRMLVLGQAFVSMDSVPALSFGPPGQWTMLRPQGTAPSVRDAPAAVYDPVRDRVLMFGGYRPNLIGGGTGLDDLWELTLGPVPTWTPITTPGTKPPGRGYHGMVYDAANDRLVVIGGLPSGSTGASALRDVWQLSLGGAPPWHQLTPLGLPPVSLSAVRVVQDAPRHRALVYACNGLADSVYALSLESPESWAYLAPADGPPLARRFTAAVFDPD